MESNPFLGQPVHVFRFDVLVAETRKVPPAHVVNEDENHVGSLGRDVSRQDAVSENQQTDDDRLDMPSVSCRSMSHLFVASDSASIRTY